MVLKIWAVIGPILGVCAALFFAGVGLDTALKIWAVLGPLLAAAISSVWARSMQLEDRKSEDSRNDGRRRAEKEDRNDDAAHALRRERYLEIKNAFAELLSSSQEFIRSQSDDITNPSPELHSLAVEAHSRFSMSSQTVVLLVDEGLANMAINLWNTAFGVPRNYNADHTEPAYVQSVEQYRAARAAFTVGARAYLVNLQE